jgi:NAD(P)-dependent dehydrogenase (short-subunit alcohol dehydrogenase family)
VVIGGSAGIGLETARRARAEGADVILTGRNPVGSSKRVNSARSVPPVGPPRPATPGRHRGFERSPDGLLAAARVHDDVDAPVILS